MRFARTITAIVAFALIGLLPFGSADAASPTTTTATSSSLAATPPSSARAATKIGIKIVKKRGKLILLGNVQPPKGPVNIQKATNCTSRGVCNFKSYRTVGVKNGRYQVRVYAPKHGSWAWRARVGSTKSDTWVTCTRVSTSTPCPTP